jgi:hypothetical protein
MKKLREAEKKENQDAAKKTGEVVDVLSSRSFAPVIECIRIRLVPAYPSLPVTPLTARERVIFHPPC